MKKNIGLFLAVYLLPVMAGSAQTNAIDSLRQLLQNEKQDTSRVLRLNQLSSLYLYNKPDTALVLGQQGYTLAKEIGFAKGAAVSLNRMGNAFNVTGNYPKALELHLASLKMAEDVKDEKTMHITLSNIGTDYSYQGNYRQAADYTRQALLIVQRLDDKKRIVICLINLGDSYEKLDILDSARIYINQAYELGVQLKDAGITGIALNNLGNIYSKMGQDAIAMNNYNLSLPYYIQEEDEDGLCEAYLGIAKLFRKAGKTDSCLYYAKLSLAYGKKGGFTVRVMNASNFLTDYYTSIHNVDSAFVYQSATIAAKDSLFSQEKQRAIQGLSFDESMRQQEIQAAKEAAQTQLKFNVLFGGLTALLIVAFLLYRNNWQRKKANVLLKQQKEKVESTLQKLKSTQAQLVQSEKMASLGELTAGIAHEIQNPLNFVNNFSEVNSELIDEADQEIAKGNISELKTILHDIKENQQKINHHGKRADAIVKGMLEHSRQSKGIKELTDINALANEYLRLSYHGLRAKEKDFNVDLKTEVDAAIGKINIVPQDIGRVLLNLFNNAFYAVNEKKKNADENYNPFVSIQTKKVNSSIEIKVRDNGSGIPQNIIDKIFQPFFTTKPTGQGTGLGLSLVYDVITKEHNGSIKVESKEGGTTFIIQLPAN